MKLFISKILYHIGDFISLTTMRWVNGFGWSLYNKIMLWSCDLDNEGKIWKYVKPNKNRKRRNK
jgi:hypothetical protein